MCCCRRDGTFLELGAYSGVKFSNMYVLEELLGWRGVNIEAGQDMYEQLVRNRPGQVNVKAVVCNQSAPLHFLERRDTLTGIGGLVNGIVEFMAPTFLERWHPVVNRTDDGVGSTTSGKEDLESLVLDINSDSSGNLIPSDAREVYCASLTEILLDTLGMSHINFWVLDVEGGELQVLYTVDFTKVSFDVIAVEADGENPEKDSAVIDLLQSKGYNLRGGVGRSNWFVRQGFVATVSPPMPSTSFLRNYLLGHFGLQAAVAASVRSSATGRGEGSQFETEVQ